jgi:hypothetical protein
MTPLSVHNRGGGHTSSTPVDAATSERRLRTYAFAATPPATTSDLTSAGACHKLVPIPHPSYFMNPVS